ncbi:MAG: lipocalin family protein [Gammaproteobacteria bacterium]|nr:lipocalin family protein [Gammaproteobacteria bacterium]
MPHRGFYLILTTLILVGCTGKPNGVVPVTGFDAERYTGRWYEVARFDHIFERGLSNVSAIYQQQNDGRIRVTNRGYHEREGVWKEVDAVGEFTVDPSVAQLRVSLFGPLYGGYNVIELDRAGYEYAMVAGNSRAYLWILARDTSLPMPVLERLIEKGRTLGFPVERLIFVAHGTHQ